MANATGLQEFKEECKGHPFELAFRANSPEEVDTAYNDIIKKGAIAIKELADMPWKQRTAFFADPDGNVHEVFADIIVHKTSHQ
jgi:lactoylglutathione lyase